MVAVFGSPSPPDTYPNVLTVEHKAAGFQITVEAATPAMTKVVYDAIRSAVCDAAALLRTTGGS